MAKLIEISNLYTVLGSKIVHNTVDLEINQGETQVIIGGSGSGKSVLLKCIVGLLRPQGGELKVFSENILKYSEQEWIHLRKRMAVLFQGAALFDSLTVDENVAFALKRYTTLSLDEIGDRVEEKLNLVGLSGFQHYMPSELSVGMQKRVGLARAVALDPELILYDEPTTGLDSIMSEIINDLIIELKEKLGVTSIVVTHDMKSAYKVGDQISMLYNGKIIESGRPEEIRNSQNPYVRQFITGSSIGPINWL